MVTLNPLVRVKLQMQTAIWSQFLLAPPKTTIISCCLFHYVFLLELFMTLIHEIIIYNPIFLREIFPTSTKKKLQLLLTVEPPPPHIIPYPPPLSGKTTKDGFLGPTFAAFELKTKPSEPPRWELAMVDQPPS